MIRIIAIERSGSTCAVQFDGAPTLRCSRAFARRLRLSPGQQIDSAMLERVRQTAAADLAEHFVQRLLQRPRSRRELAARLLREGIADSVVRETLEQLEQQGDHDESGDALAIARQCAARGAQDWNTMRQRCGQRLRRRGFSAATALRAVQLAWQETRQELSEPIPRDLGDSQDGSEDDSQIEPIASAKFRSPVP